MINEVSRRTKGIPRHPHNSGSIQGVYQEAWGNREIKIWKASLVELINYVMGIKNDHTGWPSDRVDYQCNRCHKIYDRVAMGRLLRRDGVGLPARRI